MRPKPIAAKPGQESVWHYPRPPQLEHCERHLRVVHRGVVIAETQRALRMLETSHPPTYYFPPQDVRFEHLVAEASARSSCEWKGRARYYTVTVGADVIARAAWSYPQPDQRYPEIVDHVAFYAGKVEQCTVDGERVTPQPGEFYGGWITGDLAGPFKGGPGSSGW